MRQPNEVVEERLIGSFKPLVSDEAMAETLGKAAAMGIVQALEDEGYSVVKAGELEVPQAAKATSNRIDGRVQHSTPKALLIEVRSGHQGWLPRSAIKRIVSGSPLGVASAYSLTAGDHVVVEVHDWFIGKASAELFQ